MIPIFRAETAGVKFWLSIGVGINNPVYHPYDVSSQLGTVSYIRIIVYWPAGLQHIC